MRRIDRRHLLPGAAAFAAALLVALLGLNAGANTPGAKPRAGTVQIQLRIEYDPMPPFDTGSLEKAPERIRALAQSPSPTSA